MPQMNFVNSISGGGVQIAGNAIRDTDSVSGLTPTLPKGKAGSLTTRTDNNTGVATLGASHGIVTSDFGGDEVSVEHVTARHRDSSRGRRIWR